MAEQSYQPYRSALLLRAELAELNQLNVSRVVIDILMLWLQIVACWAIAALYPKWWLVILAAALVGNRYYSLFIVGHDGLHRRLHPRREVNDFVNDVFVLGPLGAITRINRLNHMRHHGTLAFSKDPDAYKYATRWTRGSFAYLFSLTGIPFVFRALANVYAVKNVAVRGHHEPYTPRDIAIIAGWQVLLSVLLTLAFGWWGYFVMWWIPVYVFTFAADILRVFCEHSVESVNGASLHDRLVTFAAGPIELALFAPMNMNHHVAHHLWPSIPYRNLPKATAILYSRVATVSADMPTPGIRRSYLRYLAHCLSLARMPREAH